MPPPSMRTLARRLSDPENSEAHTEQEQQTRQEVWSQAQAQRRKYVQVLPWLNKHKDSLAAAFNKSRVSDFRGVKKESHRGFFLSADLLGEHPAEPWRIPAPVDEKLMTTIFDSSMGRPQSPLIFSSSSTAGTGWRGGSTRTSSRKGLTSTSVGCCTLATAG